MAKSKRAVPWSRGPFVGMRYTTDPTLQDKRFVYFAKNMAPLDHKGGPYARLMSFNVVDTGLAAAPQLSIYFAAAENTVYIIGGQLYLGEGAFGAPFVTAATIAAAGAALSAVNTCWCVEFNGQLIIHDGVNRPFAVSTAGVVTNLTNAPASVVGQPAVYYGKLFFIKGSDPKTIAWSEENQSNTGYEAGGFNNAWTLTQAGAGRLYAIRGTNEGLYYWRQGSTGVIRGAVTPDFTAAGTHDEISREHGSVSGSTLGIGQAVYFVDQYGQPCVLRSGVLTNLGPKIADAFADAGTAGAFPGASRDAGESRVAYYGRYQAVVFMISDVQAQVRLFMFSAVTDEPLCQMDPDPALGVQWGVGYHMGGFRTATGFLTDIVLLARGAAGNCFIYRPPSAAAYYAPAGTTHQPTEWSLQTGPINAEQDTVWSPESLLAELDLKGGAAGAAVTAAISDGRSVGAGFVGIGQAAVGAIVVGVQAARRAYRANWAPSAAREAPFLQFKLDGNDSLAYWAVNRISGTAFPLPASVKTT